MTKFPYQLQLSLPPYASPLPGGEGGAPHMKGVGMLLGNFELNS